MTKNPILATNSGSPELDYLAAHIHSRGQLYRYVRPYVNLDRPAERILANIPLVNATWRRTLGRRKLEAPIDGDRVQLAGVPEDFAYAIYSRLAQRVLPWAGGIAHGCLQRRDEAVERTAARLVNRPLTVVAPAGLAHSVFQVARSNNGNCILNYSSAHHALRRQLFSEEGDLQPSFADTITEIYRPEVEARMDEELALADMVLVGSSFARNSLINAGVEPGRVQVVSYGTNVAHFCPDQKLEVTRAQKREFTVLFVGRIGQGKGISYLLHGYRQFRRPDTRLLLVGNYQGASKPLEPYQDLFRHIPNTPRSLLPTIYRQADVLVFPSLLEGMGLVVLEAMACGVPVIVTPNGPGDLVRDGVDGFIVPIRDAEAITNRLTYLYEHEGVRRRMASSARERALEFTWDNYAHRAFDAIQAVPAGAARFEAIS